MERKRILTKIAAVTGTILVWLPVLAMFGSALAFIAQRGGFQMDFMIPAEVFPMILIGSLTLFWASRRANYHQKQIGVIVLVTFGIPIIGQVLAVTSGLASGETEPEGLAWIAVLATIILYDLGVVLIGIEGIKLIMKRGNIQPPVPLSPV